MIIFPDMMLCFRNITVLLVVSIALQLSLSSCSSRKESIEDPSDQWAFIVFSDVQQGYGIYKQLAGNIAHISPVPSLAVCCGDIMLRAANDAEWLLFKECSKPITDRMPLYLARGNHEGNDEVCEQELSSMWSFPGKNFYYSFQVRDFAFIILDTEIKGEVNSILGSQLEWLKIQLDSFSVMNGIKYVFLFMHHPLYPQGLHQGSNLSNADEIHELFRQHPKVKAVFAGHDHMFNKFIKDNILYITTGGGGANLYHGYGGDYHHFVKVGYRKNNEKFNLKTIGIFNEIVENFDF